MDNLRNQVAALRQGIATSACERANVIAEIKIQTANMLRAFGRERMAMAKALKSDLASDRMSRSADVLAIRDKTSMMCEGFRQDHGRMRRSLRQRLIQSRKAVMTSVASLRVAFAKERGGFSKVHRQMAKARRAGGIKGRRDRSHAVAELMKDFHASHGKMAHELAQSLAKSTQAIKAQVAGLSWSGASVLKTGKGVLPTQMGSSLLAAQSGENFPASMPAPDRPPETDAKETDQDKTTLGETVRHTIGKPWKAKKK